MAAAAARTLAWSSDALSAGVRAAASVDHIHLARGYEVNDRGSAYAVIEWNGGVSIADRLEAAGLETDPIRSRAQQVAQ